MCLWLCCRLRIDQTNHRDELFAAGSQIAELRKEPPLPSVLHIISGEEVTIKLK